MGGVERIGWEEVEWGGRNGVGRMRLVMGEGGQPEAGQAVN